MGGPLSRLPTLDLNWRFRVNLDVNLDCR